MNIIQKIAMTALVMFSVLSMGACTSTELGAGAGAVGGSVLTGGSVAGTVGGAVVGGVIGHEESKEGKR